MHEELKTKCKTGLSLFRKRTIQLIADKLDIRASFRACYKTQSPKDKTEKNRKMKGMLMRKIEESINIEI